MKVYQSAIVLASLYRCTSAFAPKFNSVSNAGVNSGTTLSMSAALIVQNKGGGHGELGYQLAKNLSSNPKITSITILQDDACNDANEPFSSYKTDLPDVKVVKASLSDESMTAADLQSLLGQSFDYVWDNASKTPEGAGKAICDSAKEWNCKIFAYVSSAGIYVPTDETTFPMAETTPIKHSSGQAKFDAYAVEIGLRNYVSFRPQYIYGPKSNKNDYIDWYFDRLVRGEPLPIPGDGTQKVSLTNSEDVASVLASVLDNEEAAVEQRFFNCGTDKLVSYGEVASLCAKAAGISEFKVEYYDASKGKGKFPFRLTDFYVSPDMVKSKLGWYGAKHDLEGDLAWYYEGYQNRGGTEKDVDFSADKEVLA